MKIFTKIIHLFGCALLSAGLLALAGGAARAAGKVAAVVEQGATANGEIQVLDRLPAGTEFTLGNGETMILAYTRSCIRETITGGKVTVGAEQSEVAGGEVVREEVKTCPEPRLALSAAESQESATIAFRGGVRHLFSRTPLLASRDGNLRISIFQGETLIGEIKTEGGEFDLLADRLELTPGKTFRVESDSNTVLVEIDADAKAGGDFLTRYVYID